MNCHKKWRNPEIRCPYHTVDKLLGVDLCRYPSYSEKGCYAELDLSKEYDLESSTRFTLISLEKWGELLNLL